MLTTYVLKFMVSFSILFLVGMMLGNSILIFLSLIPLFVMLFSLAFGTPKEVKFSRSKEIVVAKVDEEVEICGTAHVEKGVGIITLADAIPEHLELTRGSNFKVFWKGLKPVSMEVKYTVKCTRRGIYNVGPLSYECIHFSGLIQTGINKDESLTKLEVRPKTLEVKRLRDPRLLSRIPMPLGSLAKVGIMTTDFKEIREYHSGDSFKCINWKATARLASQKHQQPFVNEFEREGKKVVWIMVDGSQNMALGTNVKNAFEYALQAAFGLAQFYLARNCNVGLCIYSKKGRRLLLPDSGRRQKYKILKEILNARIASESGGFKSAVKSLRGHIAGANPYFIIITSIRNDSLPELVSGIKDLRKYSRAIRKIPQIMVIHVSGYSIAATDNYEKLAATMLEIGNMQAIRLLRKAGASVTVWNPLRQSLANLLVVGLARK